MPDLDLAKLPDLLKRLDDTDGSFPFADIFNLLSEAAAAIRALMAERDAAVTVKDAAACPDVVEDAAKKLFCQYDDLADDNDWDEMGDTIQEGYRSTAREILDAAVAAEREACAEVCDDIAIAMERLVLGSARVDPALVTVVRTARECAAKIRARGVA